MELTEIDQGGVDLAIRKLYLTHATVGGGQIGTRLGIVGIGAHEGFPYGQPFSIADQGLGRAAHVLKEESDAFVAGADVALGDGAARVGLKQRFGNGEILAVAREGFGHFTL